MRRILICTHPLCYGGSQLSIHHWAKHLNPVEYEVVILASERGGLSEKFESHYEVHYDADEYPRIEEYIDTLSPDLVHACPGGGVDHRYIQAAARRVPVTQTMMCPYLAGNLDVTAKVAVPSEYVLSMQPDISKIIHIDHPFDMSEYSADFDRAHSPRRLSALARRSNITVIPRFLSENEKISLFHLADIFLYPTFEEA
ncbi:MAG: glycosyltransferase family protein, partial [Planctomycetota bacterium]